jgi:hypothetical protein
VVGIGNGHIENLGADGHNYPGHLGNPKRYPKEGEGHKQWKDAPEYVVVAHIQHTPVFMSHHSLFGINLNLDFESETATLFVRETIRERPPESVIPAAWSCVEVLSSPVVVVEPCLQNYPRNHDVVR